MIDLVQAKLEGTWFVCELPHSNSEWRMLPITMNGQQYIIAVNPEHPPFIIKDGIAKELRF